MERMYIDIESIQNKDQFELIKENVVCSICQGLIYHPQQCQKCEHNFCNDCIKLWLRNHNTCPFRCQNPTFKESRLMKNLLEKLNFKCPLGCDDIINYDDIDKHKQVCYKTSYKQKCIDYENKIKELENKNKELENKIKDYEKKNLNITSNNKIKELENIIKDLKKQINIPSNLKSWQKKSTLHNHPLIFCTTKRSTSWFCDICKKFFDNDHYSYLCTLCDFDICENCFK
jgi:hypothetical protein